MDKTLKAQNTVDWLIKHASYDEATDELYYHNGDGQKIVMKTYRRNGAITAVYVPATGYQLGWARAVEAVKTGADPGRGMSAAIAANARWGRAQRTLPKNVYPMSDGRFIGRKGEKRTAPYGTADAAFAAVQAGDWVND